MELKILDIYADDRVEPTISITYKLKDNKEKLIELFNVWVRNDKDEDYEILNYANLIYYNVMIHNKQPNEKHIYRVYQNLFSNKLWEKPNELTIKVNYRGTLLTAPHRNFTRFTKKTMQEFVERQTIKYIKKVKGDKKSCVEKNNHEQITTISN